MSKQFGVARALLLAGVLAFCGARVGLADDKTTIDANTQRALAWLRESGGDAAELLDRAAGVLVFPDIVRMGFGVGGEFGEGALLVDGESVAYYATAGDTYGHLPGAEYKAKVIFFMTRQALLDFRNTQPWQVGEHGELTLVTDTSQGVAALDSAGPLIGLVFSEAGVLADLDFDGNRITRIQR